MAEHSDSFSKTQPAGEQATAQPAQQQVKQTSNDAQAAVAEAERQREYPTGGDGPETPAARSAAAIARLDAAVARVKRGDRPSPFGTGYFPPLPAPPGRR